MASINGFSHVTRSVSEGVFVGQVFETHTNVPGQSQA